MEKKNLIIYASLTGNTEKIANEIAKNFEKHGWSNDLKKIPKGYDVKNPDFSFNDYDFACVGSPVHSELPVQEIRTLAYGKPGGGRVHTGPKCGLVFCTYAGVHLGPLEAAPSLKLLELELSHQAFEVIGSFAVPGGGESGPKSHYYFDDLHTRPNEKDLTMVEIIVDDIMNQLKSKPYYR